MVPLHHNRARRQPRGSFPARSPALRLSDPTGPPASGSTGYAQSVHAILLHNTIAHQTPVASFGVQVGPDSTIEMTNNIVTNFYVGIRRASTSTGSAVADYTLFHSNEYDYDPGVSSSHEVHGDPAFVGTGDYHITAASAAIDAGKAAGITIDYDGASRPWGSGYDIGADEYPPRVSVHLPLVQRGY